MLLLLELELNINTCGIAYHTLQPGLRTPLLFVYPKHMDYAHLGCFHCWVSEILDTDPSKVPLPAESCLAIRE